MVCLLPDKHIDRAGLIWVCLPIVVTEGAPQNYLMERMMEYWHAFTDWFLALGEPYGVNPLIFGAIYVGAVPFFWLAIAWLVRNLRTGRQVAGPVLMACGFAISAYVYLIIAGENVPVWVYFFIIAIIAYAIYVTLKKVRQKIRETEAARQLSEAAPETETKEVP